MYVLDRTLKKLRHQAMVAQAFNSTAQEAKADESM